MIGPQGARDVVLRLARTEQLTVRQILGRVGTWHRIVVGTPEQMADTIEEWFLAGAADGFNLMPDLGPSGLQDFADNVVPILQDRGVFRREYRGPTFREHLGLRRPQVSGAAEHDVALAN
jgi:alkanesulfonate monooxygenase SsuD/methylene tetrahydromethanopterin reductase-like flavin-dependent oxidoreductase (luciferase family)